MKLGAKLFTVKNLLRGNPLKWVALCGLVFCLVLAWILVIYSLTRNRTVFPERAGTAFARGLERYDDAAALALESPENFENRLDRLETLVKTQDEMLSILKRRRNLAEIDANYRDEYQKSAEEAAKTFPYSDVMAAIAGESLVYGQILPETAEKLIAYAEKITQERFFPLALSLNVLAGALQSPELAPGVANIEKLLASELPPRLAESVLTDDILLRIIDTDADRARETAIRIAERAETHPDSETWLRLAGEFFYDHGNPARSAEFFSRLGNEYAGRSADALALAGETQAAAIIWRALANSTDEAPETRVNSLYNLAATASGEREAAALLEKIFAARENSNSRAEIAAIIRYSRLQETGRGIAMLEDGSLPENALLDLELLRRRREILPPDRVVAELWLLLGRHPDAGPLYEWGAWFFDRQKLYGETAQLLKIVGQKNMTAGWIDLCRGLFFLREGNLDDGRKILEPGAGQTTDNWRIPANLARAAESNRQVSAALELYQTAAELAKAPKDAARVQLRISRCYEALNRFEESLTALEYAAKLDPDNLNVRIELQRRGGR